MDRNSLEGTGAEVDGDQVLARCLSEPSLQAVRPFPFPPRKYLEWNRTWGWLCKSKGRHPHGFLYSDD